MKLSNLSLGRKLALLGLVGALLFLAPFAFYARQALAVVETSQHEQAGIAPARALVRVVQLTQQHRGLFSGGMNEQRSAKQAEADRQYAQLGTLLAGPAGDAALAGAWKRLAGQWSELTQAIAAGSLQRADGFARHTELLARELELLVRLTEHYGLAFESEARAHHLVQATLVHLPDLTESLGRARARGTAYLVAQKLDQQEQTAIAVFAQTARMLQASTSLALEKAMALDPALKTALGPMHQESVQESAKVLALIEAEILRGSAPTHAGTEYFAALTQAIDTQFRLLDRSTEQLDATFRQRGSELQLQLTLALTGLVALFLLVIGFGYALAQAIARPLRQAVAVAREVAQGNLAVDVPAGGRDEIGQLLVALQEMTINLRRLVGEVAQGARMVADTSAQIAQGNLDLSQRTEEQASTLEESASSMEELTSTVTQNADHAREASQLALGASEVARRGGEVVGQVVSTMNGITESSHRISEIIGVIDGIAFQTNILALNAAVEAARAGEQGRGFAVVAAEVRNLAQRSASAAKEIKALIGESVGKVGAGAKLVDSAGRTMGEIVAAVQKVSDLVAEISAASQEQSSGIEQVNTAVTQMDQIVQQNASLVEEAAAATESMKAQSAHLLQLVSRFRVGSEDVPQDVARVPALPVSTPAPAAAPAAAPEAPQRIRVKAPASVPAAVLSGKRLNGSAPAAGEWTEF